MSSNDINKVDNEDNKTLDKQQIEAEEKEVMLKENEATEVDVELRNDGGPVKAALSGDITEHGREVKPKFIPIGAIKMPGFFTRNSDREKSKEEEAIEKDIDNEKGHDKMDDESKPKQRFKFLQTCPFSQFLHPTPKENEGDTPTNKKGFGMFNMQYPKIFQKRSVTTEAALASMETLEDKLDTPNDGMENVKLDVVDDQEGKVATRLPFKERIRQKKFITDDIMVCGLIVLVLIAVITGIVIGARVGPPTERPLRLGRFITTQTSCGLVEGILDKGVYNFYSIPYALPPIKEKRFTYAQTLNNLSMCWNGTLQVTEPGPLCIQFLDNGTIIGEEDCLTLDIVTPHVRYDSPLPVVVLIGANTLAGGISPAQPSASYARNNEVIFVRPNFRLGAFGFLALDILSNSKYPPTSGNYGLSDLLAALEWIQHNIKHFGGDPQSVTLLGHRAGATLAAALTTVRQAHKLYSRAWLSSPSVVFPGEPPELAHKNNEQFKHNIKCEDVECLRRADAGEIISATPDTWLGSDVDTLPVAGETKRSWLVLDGVYLRTHAYESWDAQKLARSAGKDKIFKPMVFGTTRRSGHSELLRAKHVDWTPENVERTVNESLLGERNLTGRLFELVERSYSGLTELVAATRTLCPLVSLARMRLGAPLYVAEGPGPAGAPGREGAPGQEEGPGQAEGGAGDADVRAALGSLRPAAPAHRRHMAAVQQLFYSFVWHGRAPPGLLRVAQDALPLPALPLCDLLIGEDVVPRYAHVD